LADLDDVADLGFDFYRSQESLAATRYCLPPVLMTANIFCLSLFGRPSMNRFWRFGRLFVSLRVQNKRRGEPPRDCALSLTEGWVEVKASATGKRDSRAASGLSQAHGKHRGPDGRPGQEAGLPGRFGLVTCCPAVI